MTPLVAVPAEIVAHVWQVQVQVGQSVEEGQQLAVLESMKMEIPVLAPCSGVVRELPVPVGHIVQEGDPVVVLDTGQKFDATDGTSSAS